jgi:hypothetical protein
MGLALAVASTSALALVGCSTAQPVPDVASSPSASEEQLTEEARTAWEKYVATLGELAADPEGATIDPLLEVATAEVAEIQFANIERAAAVGARIEGTRQTTAFIPAGPVQLRSATFGVCVDTTTERVLDFAGVEIPRGDQALLRSQTVQFERESEFEHYVVSSDRDYAGPAEADPCG